MNFHRDVVVAGASAGVVEALHTPARAGPLDAVPAGHGAPLTGGLVSPPGTGPN